MNDLMNTKSCYTCDTDHVAHGNYLSSDLII